MRCHNYIFFDIEPSIHTVPAADLKEQKAEFAACIKNSPLVKTVAFTTLGLKSGTRFMLWFEADEVDAVQSLLNELMHTPLGAHLKITYTLFGMIRESQYAKKREGQKEGEQEASAAPIPEVVRKGRRYLIVYPFTKTIAWHLLDYETRRNLMWAHVQVGRKFSASIEQVLLYAYGVDDHEFIVSYETDSLYDFQTLVMELRSTEARRYTEHDTPIFTCLRASIDEALEMI